MNQAPALVPLPKRRPVIGSRWSPEPASYRGSDGTFWARNIQPDDMSTHELRLQRALLKK